jgi:hypothetical protein
MTRLLYIPNIILLLSLAGCISSPGYLFSDDGVTVEADEPIVDTVGTEGQVVEKDVWDDDDPIEKPELPASVMDVCQSESQDQLSQRSRLTAYQALAADIQLLLVDMLCAPGGEVLAENSLYIEPIDVNNPSQKVSKLTIKFIHSVLLNEARALGLMISDKPVSMPVSLVFRNQLSHIGQEYVLQCQVLASDKKSVVSMGMTRLPLAHFASKSKSKIKDGIVLTPPAEQE